MENKNLNVAVIGAGWWACFNHIPGLKQRGVKNFFIVDRDDSKFIKIKKEFNDIDHFYNDLDELLDKQSIHGAVVASPHTAHFENAEKALKRGIPVLIEKPMTTNTEDAKILVRLAKKNNTQIMIPHGFNFLKSTLKAKTLIKKIGKVEHISAQVGSALLDLFSGKNLKGTESHLFRPPPDTWSNPRNAGGYAWGQLVHLLGLLFTLVDDDPWKIAAFINNSKVNVDMYNTIAGKLKSGTSINISGAGSVPKSRDIHNDLRIYGEKGLFIFDLEENRERLEVILHSGNVETIVVSRKDCFYDGMSPHDPFIRLCKKKLPVKENHADGMVGLSSVALIEAMFESAKKEKIIRIAL